MKIRKTKSVSIGYMDGRKRHDYEEILLILKKIQPGEEFDLPEKSYVNHFRLAMRCASVLLDKQIFSRRKDDKTRTIFCQ